MNKFFIGLFLIIASQANATASMIPPVTIHCESVNASPAIQLNGVFQEEANRHGSGSLSFTVYPLQGPMNALLSRAGSGEWTSNSEIAFTEGSLSSGGKPVEARFSDTSLDEGTSSLTVNGKTTSLSCQVNVPNLHSPRDCNQWCDCHNCR